MLGALALALGGMETARGQYAVTGTTAGGGNNITGSGLLGSLVSGDGTLSAGGFDKLNLSAGSFAIGSGTDTVTFTTGNNTLLSSGTIGADTGFSAVVFEGNPTHETISTGLTSLILGGAGTPDTGSGGGDGGNGLYIHSPSGSSIDTISIANSGVMTGGNGGTASANYSSGGYGGDGINLSAYDSISNVNISNHGTISGGLGENGGPGGYGGYGGSGIFVSSGTVNGISIVNSGEILGGDSVSNINYHSSTIGSGGQGIYLYSSYDYENVSVSNAGTIAGGRGGDGGKYSYAGEGGDGAFFEGYYGINGVTVGNSGNILGGNGGMGTDLAYDSGRGGDSIEINTQEGFLQNISITNSGNIFGGNGGTGGNEAYGGDAGNAVYILSHDDNIANVTIKNSGIIRGGNGGNGDDANFLNGGWGGYGVDIIASGNVSNVSIANTGSILGGNGGNSGYGLEAINIAGTQDGISGVSITNSGDIIGGIGGSSASQNASHGGGGILLRSNDDVDNVMLANTGRIIGGNGGISTALSRLSGGGSYGVDIEGGGDMHNIAITNSGLIQGGNGGAEVDMDVAGVSGGINVRANGVLTNLSLVNTGNVIGGNAIGSNYTAGTAVNIFGNPIGSADSNIVVSNYGTLQGGSGINGATAGAGVTLETSNAVLNNWGTISAGGGANAVGISVQGLNNTVNLNGHSSVNGLIAASSDSNNVLNLNFTGLSPQAIAALKAQIAAQGNTQNFTGSFTVRGVTYNVDPMVIHINATSYQASALTPNQFAIAANLDSFAVNPTGDMLTVLNTVDASGDPASAFEAFSPQKYQIFGDIAFATQNSLSLGIDERLNNLRDGSENIDTMGIGGDNATTTAGFSKDGKDNKNVVVPEAKGSERRWGFFASGDVLLGNFDARQNMQESKFDTAGLILGVDGRINENWVIGALFDYQHTTADMDSIGSEARVDSYGGGIYSGYHNGGYFANGLVTYGHNDYDSTRVIAFPGLTRFASSNTSGDQEGANLDGGYDFKINESLTVGPIAGLQYTHLRVDGFNEYGAGSASLAVDSQDADSLRSRLGFRADFHKQIGREVAFAAEGRAEWQHEFLDDSRDISASFLGSGLGSFAVGTTKPERDAALVGGGINFTVRDRMTIFVDYNAQVGQESYFEQSVKGGLKFSF